MDVGVVWCQPAVFWKQLFVFANHLPLNSTSDDAAMWIVVCEIKKKTNLHLPKDSAAVGYQRHALLKVRDGSQLWFQPV
jgi:hypothetical protein